MEDLSGTNWREQTRGSCLYFLLPDWARLSPLGVEGPYFPYTTARIGFFQPIPKIRGGIRRPFLPADVREGFASPRLSESNLVTWEEET